MTYDLFLRGPEVYVPILLLSMAITLVAYGVAPLLFAWFRKKPITRKKYRILCFVINAFVMMLFVAANGTSSGGPYALWTWVFSSLGTKILNGKGIMENLDDVKKSKTQSCSASDKPQTHLDVEVNNNRIYFCRKCGEKLVENSRFCRKCGTEIVKE